MPSCLNSKLSIIGFDAFTPEMDCVDQVAAALYKGQVNALQAFDSVCFKDKASLYQQAITRILKDGALKSSQIAVIMLSEVECDMTGHDYASCHSAANLGDALVLSECLLNEQQVAVLLIAANVKGNIANEKATISFAADFNGYGNQHGVCALLLSRDDIAATTHAYQYAYIESAVSNEVSEQAINDCISQSFNQAEISSVQVSSLEVSANANPMLAEIESSGILNAYQNQKTLHTSLSCHKSVFGENGSLSQLMGLLNCVLALQQGYRPAMQDWSTPNACHTQQWLSSPFYIFNQAAPAFTNSDSSPRYMGYSCLSETQYSHLVLQENHDHKVHDNGFLACADLSLFIITGNSLAQLQTQLNKLNESLNSLSCKALATSLYQAYQTSIEHNYKMVLLAETAEQLAHEIDMAIKALPSVLTEQGIWKTPKGSYFSAQPLNDADNIGFIYPGIGASYLGLGRDLMHLFPQILPSIKALSKDLGRTLQDQLVYPRSLSALDFKTRQQCDQKLRSELANIAQCGVGYAYIFNKIFTQVFNVTPNYAAGYSMGEVSMFTALGCWKTPQLMSQRLLDSTTFKERLAGKLEAIRELWQLSDQEQHEIWESYSVKATPKQIEQVLLAKDRVYITIINSPDNVIIAGYPKDCLALCQRLAVRAIPLQVANAIHCPPAYSEYDNMQALYSLEVADKVSCKMYSSSCYLPIPQLSKAIAIAISKCLCEPVDFPRLMNTLYQQGCRVFIEMGAGSSLTSWTDKIIQTSKVSDYSCVAVNGKGITDQVSISRAVAKLLSMGVKLNLDCFFHGSVIQPVQPLNHS